MKLFFDLPTGEIIRAIYDKDVFSTMQDENTGVFSIDEIAENLLLCKDLSEVHMIRDNNQQGKYYIDTSTVELYERDGWIEPPPLIGTIL